MLDEAELAALIGSRICHDLISPIGAIGNGVELLVMSGGTQSPEIALISQSVTHAISRLRFFRVAFGAANAEQKIGSPEVVSILSDMTRGSRLSVGWQAPLELSRAEVRRVFLALMCLESAMPWGGKVSIHRDESGWSLLGTAARLRLDPELWTPLIDGAMPGSRNPAFVHFLLLAADLALHPARIAISDEGITIGL